VLAKVVISDTNFLFRHSRRP